MKPARDNCLWILGCAILVTFFFPSATLADENTGNAAVTKAVAGFEYPAGDTGDVAEAFLDAFNTGNEEVVADFYVAHETEATFEKRPLKEQLYRYKGLYKLMGTLVPHGVLELEKSEIVLLVKSEKRGTWFKVGFEFESGVSGQLENHYVRPVPPPNAVGKS